MTLTNLSRFSVPQNYRSITFLLAIAVLSNSVCDTASAQRGRRGGRGPGANPTMREDMTTLHAMFANRDKIKRTIKMLPNGAEAVTESDDEKIAALLQEHVPAMESRVYERNPLPPMTFHPVFVNLIKHADDYTLTYEDTDKGTKVTYEADDPFVVMLVQEHAKLVSRFIKNGMEEIHRPYTLPKVKSENAASGNRDSSTNPPKYVNPAIRDYGKVAKLVGAAHQPRDGSKIVVDITNASDPDKLSSDIEKVCRFVNIYAGAGKDSANVDIVVVLHGDATLTALNDDAYSTRFNTNGNPNLDCLRELRTAGVGFAVCGQSLISKGATPSQVSEHVEVAVSALTALVNLQADGYAYVPLLE